LCRPIATNVKRESASFPPSHASTTLALITQVSAIPRQGLFRADDNL